MNKFTSKYSSSIAIVMLVLSIAMFIAVLLLFLGCFSTKIEERSGIILEELGQTYNKSNGLFYYKVQEFGEEEPKIIGEVYDIYSKGDTLSYKTTVKTNRYERNFSKCWEKSTQRIISAMQ